MISIHNALPPLVQNASEVLVVLTSAMVMVPIFIFHDNNILLRLVWTGSTGTVSDREVMLLKLCCSPKFFHIRFRHL